MGLWEKPKEPTLSCCFHNPSCSSSSSFITMDYWL